MASVASPAGAAADTAAAGERGRWSSRAAFLLTAMGAAIGLGNIWRFPYLSYSYGGGAFFIPYLGALFLIGIPLLTTELALGQVYQGGHAVAFGMLSKRFIGLGYGSAWACFIVAAYYNVLLAYACLYFVASFQNPLPWAATAKTAQLCKTAGASAASCAALGTECMWADGECSQALIGKANAYLYETVLEQSDVSGGIGWLVPHIAVAALVVWVICYLSLFKGASLLGYVASTSVVLPFVLLGALIITGLSLPGMEMGVHQYIGRWDLSILSSRPQIWSDATAQIFFSVGAVWGYITAYASYNKKGQNVAQDALIVSLSDSACAILAGLAAFSICGHLAYEAGIPLDELPTESRGLAFVSYPIGLAQIPGWGAQLFNVFFFAVLICLGVASSFSFVECPATVLLDTSWFGRVPRWLMVGILSVVGYGLSLVYSTDIGYHLIDASDWYVANVLALSLGFLESVAVGWAARIDVQEGHIGKKAPWVLMCGFVGSIAVATIVQCILLAILPGVTVLIGVCIWLGLLAVSMVASYLLIETKEMMGWKVKLWWLYLGNIETLRKELNHVVAPGKSRWRITPLWSLLIKFFCPLVTCVLVGVSCSENLNSYKGFPSGVQAMGMAMAFSGLALFFAAAIFPDRFGAKSLLKQHKQMHIEPSPPSLPPPVCKSPLALPTEPEPQSVADASLSSTEEQSGERSSLNSVSSPGSEGGNAQRPKASLEKSSAW